MSMTSSTIRNIVSQDLPEIVAIHSSELPDDFCSLLGPKFLATVYYPELLQQRDCVALCFTKDNTICGFVFFSKSPDFHKQLLKTHWSSFLRYASCQILNLRFYKYIFEVVCLLFFRKPDRFESEYELSYIAVRRSFSRQGIGRALVQHGLQEIQKKNATMCYVKTLEHSPDTVAFYKSLGFDTYSIFLGRVFLSINAHGDHA